MKSNHIKQINFQKFSTGHAYMKWFGRNLPDYAKIKAKKKKTLLKIETVYSPKLNNN